MGSLPLQLKEGEEPRHTVPYTVLYAKDVQQINDWLIGMAQLLQDSYTLGLA